MNVRRNQIVYVIWLSIVASIGGFLFGYDTAVISGTVDQVAKQFRLDEMMVGWYVGCALVGSIIGVMFAGYLSDKFGRKKVMVLAAVLFSASGLGCMISANEVQLVIYRIVGGIGIGVASIVSPLYIAEVSVPSFRGRLVSMYQLAITVGFLGAYLANYGLQQYSESLLRVGSTAGLYGKIFGTEVWRSMLGMESVPAVVFLLVLFFIPESPRWLIVQGKDTIAVAILGRIFGDTEAEIQKNNVKSLIATEHGSDWKLLLQPGFRLALFIGVALAMLGQFMGVNAVLYYGPTIFKETGLSAGDSLFYQSLVGAVNMLTTIIALIIIDRVGRKKLVYWGVSGMIISLVLIGVYFIRGESAGISPVFLLIFFLFYIFCCAISICAVIFVLLSEMYPVKVRGAAMSIAGLSLWIGTYLIGQLTPVMLSTLTPAGTFFLFAVMCVPYMLIVWKLLPETTGKSLEEIEKMWILKGKNSLKN
jgi:SP family arabinose:H+ symporter-like MFS transporter